MLINRLLTADFAVPQNVLIISHRDTGAPGVSLKSLGHDMNKTAIFSIKHLAIHAVFSFFILFVII